MKDLLKALKGLVVMSQALETMFDSLYNNTVPKLWADKVNILKDNYNLFYSASVGISIIKAFS